MHRNIHYAFPRDENGKFDPNGTYSDTKPTQMRCIGVAVVTPIDSNGNDLPRVGRRIISFDYSRKTIMSISDYEKKVSEEITRIKNLKNGEKAGWVVEDPRAIGKIYGDDPLIKLEMSGSKLPRNLVWLEFFK